jgi:UDPglucose 6-dehydrogenase
VLGLGKLGLPLALTFAEAGHKTLVWDVDELPRDAVRRRQSHIDEPDVQGMLESLRLQLAPPGLMSEIAEVVFVIVPTPSLPSGAFSDEHVETAIDMMAYNRSSLDGPIIACVSTLSPGSSLWLSKMSRDRGMPFVYTPTMIALGSVVHDLREAEMQIIGQGALPEEQRAARVVGRVMKSVARSTPQAYMRYSSAEITKIASNAFSTMKITFANMLGHMADAHGANVNEISYGLALRGHVGSKLITAGAGFGGPCFPRDTHAFDAAGGMMGKTVHELNDRHAYMIASRVVNAHQEPPTTFSILGREYKEGSNYRIEPFSDKVSAVLEDGYELKPVDSREADVVVIAMPLRNVNLCDKIREGATVIDLWRTHPYLGMCPVRYIPFGIGETS